MSIYESLEGQQQNPVVFEHVPEQYVKGKDVVAHFSVPKEIDTSEEKDRVGLMRVCILLLFSVPFFKIFLCFLSDWYNECERLFTLC